MADMKVEYCRKINEKAKKTDPNWIFTHLDDGTPIEWVVTRDYFYEKWKDDEYYPETTSFAGVWGPSGVERIPDAELKFKWRIYDSDGELYCEGLCNDFSFAPKDDLGEPSLGCTEIRYWNEEKGEWVEL